MTHATWTVLLATALLAAGCRSGTSSNALPASFAGSYRLARSDCPSYTLTVTPRGLSSAGCDRGASAEGSIAFTTVTCASADSCAFTSPECTGSVTRQADGSLLVTAAPSPSPSGPGSLGSPSSLQDLAGMTRSLYAMTLCNGLSGTATPVRSSRFGCSVTAPGAR